MEEISNCPRCDAIFVKTQIRDVCPKCWKEEEEAYDKVYKFIRKRENRMATIPQVVEGTGVEEELILKFIKTGRLKVAQNPHLGYPCDKCGKTIQKGVLCPNCAEQLRNDLKKAEEEEKRRQEIQKQRQTTYFAVDEKFRGGEK